MSEVNELVKTAKLRFKHNESKIYLKEKYKGRLVIPFNGGMFTATIELLSFLATAKTDLVVILDNYDNPIEVVPNELYDALSMTYNSVMRDWNEEVKELNKLR